MGGHLHPHSIPGHTCLGGVVYNVQELDSFRKLADTNFRTSRSASRCFKVGLKEAWT